MNKILFSFAFLALIGCASTPTEQKVENDIKKEDANQTSALAAENGRQAIWNSTKLTGVQKDKLSSIMDQTQSKVMTIRNQEAQIKSSLFKTLANGKLSRTEILVYKSKLKNLENQKMDLMFASLKQVQDVVGVEPKHDDVYRELYPNLAW